jgi:hypothetical protein
MFLIRLTTNETAYPRNTTSLVNLANALTIDPDHTDLGIGTRIAFVDGSVRCYKETCDNILSKHTQKHSKKTWDM